MNRWHVIIGGVLIGALGFGASFDFWRQNIFSGKIAATVAQNTGVAENKQQKTIEERIQEAFVRSQNRKGVYMSAAVANDQGRSGTKLRNSILDLMKKTELNAVVIDVKEVDGMETTKNLQPFLEELHRNDIWAIARLTVMRDDSQVALHPNWYVHKTNGAVWRDNHGHAWFDPAHPEVRKYTADAAKKVIDMGFDEVQFDYIRFPSDGALNVAVYPAYRTKEEPKYKVMGEFFKYLHDELKQYKPEIILSVDLFGYVASRGNDFGVGQRLEDLKDNFDYISFMLYPSHYYSGFFMAADPERNLPEVNYPYRAANISAVVSNHPYDVVYRSILFAEDFLAGKFDKKNASSTPATATTTGEVANATNAAKETNVTKVSNARFRPFLQAFDLGADSSRGIIYDAAKIKAQIDAAERAGASGWLLWNASNVYNISALQPENSR
ncbi:hypothetical protein KGQ34_00145 [Patescibacteria group bacterium]|nr:hypothetical protein [Patescibacteria group bacterium]